MVFNTMRHMSRLIFFIVPTMLFIVACGESKPTKENNNEELKQLEEQAFSTEELDVELGLQLLRAYRAALKEQLDPEMLFKAGEVAYNLPGNEDAAMEFFTRLTIKYPKHERAPYAVFYRGLIYENRWNDKERSADIWEEFLVRYPSHELANNAAELLTMARDTVDDLEKVLKWKDQETNENVQ